MAHLTISDLAVVNFRSQYIVPELTEWRESAPVCAAQSCARQTWFGDYAVMESMPLPNSMKDKIEFYKGREAYLFMLRLMLGLETDDNLSETNILGQINDGWRVFDEQHSLEAQKLGNIFSSLTADTRLIRSRVIERYVKERKSEAALKIAPLKAAHAVTIIPHMQKNTGELSPDTLEIVSKIINRKKNFPQEIIFIHSDPLVRKKLYELKANLEMTGRLKQGITISIHSGEATLLQKAFNKSSHVFCIKPMSAGDKKDCMDFDDSMILAWDVRQNENQGRFIHFNGVPQLKGESSKLWKDFGLTAYTSPENLKHVLQEIKLSNKEILYIAANFAARFSRMRFEGRQPGKKDLTI